MTQVFDNAAPTFTGSGFLEAWFTSSYTSIGGTLFIMFSFTCFATKSNATYSFGLYIDGTLVDTTSLYFNNTGIHTTIPSCFHVNAPLSVGSHNIAVGIPTNTTVDSNDRMNMSIQEFVGLN